MKAAKPIMKAVMGNLPNQKTVAKKNINHQDMNQIQLGNQTKPQKQIPKTMKKSMDNYTGGKWKALKKLLSKESGAQMENMTATMKEIAKKLDDATEDKLTHEALEEQAFAELQGEGMKIVCVTRSR